MGSKNLATITVMLVHHRWQIEKISKRLCLSSPRDPRICSKNPASAYRHIFAIVCPHDSHRCVAHIVEAWVISETRCLTKWSLRGWRWRRHVKLQSCSATSSTTWLLLNHPRRSEFCYYGTLRPINPRIFPYISRTYPKNENSSKIPGYKNEDSNAKSYVNSR